MTVAIVLNLVFVIALLSLLAATMRLPFKFRPTGLVHLRRRRAHAARQAPARRPAALRQARSILESD
jgi:hypothetical protein